MLILGLVNAQSPVYGQCNAADYPYAAMVKLGPVNATLQQVTQAGGVSVKGYLSIFTSNLTFLNGPECYWFGGYKGSNDAMRLSTQYIFSAAQPTVQTFTFIQTAGAQASFSGFNQFRLFCPGSNLLVATADLPAITVQNAVQNTQAVVAQTQAALQPSETPTTSEATQSWSKYLISLLGSAVLLVA
ncbi:hypothetical protein EDD86DRAFT_243721 [Gorgonomyces haynaldii]|nr:hypothetical protein EDD86DRAFT_243721 [Gorgonomyces haynaldii]